jgi:hypothetical protein
VQLITGLLIILVAATARADGEETLAKESQNPVANIISLPFENNLNFGVGPEDARVNTLNLKPVYPVQVGKPCSCINTSVFMQKTGYL